MSPEEAIYILAILLVGTPSALRVHVALRVRIRVRNPTAFAMVATWLFCRLLYAATGEGMPLQGMILSDIAVIGAMFVKDDWQFCVYRGTLHQFACLWPERTPWDRAILGLFPLVWLFYFPAAAAHIGPTVRLLLPEAQDGQIQFWVLWSLSMAQMMLAGAEALHQWRGQSANRSRAGNEGPFGLEFTAWERGYG